MNKTIVFDIDDTLSDNSWLRLNIAAGVTAEEDYELYHGYSRGEFDYLEWTKRLAESYRRHNILTENLAREVLTGYTLKADTTIVVKTLLERGYDIILITGGFDITTEHLGKCLGLANYYATSKLKFNAAGLFTNFAVATDDGEVKIEILKNYCEREGKSVADCIPVGDSSNDIPLFKLTKNGIGFDWSNDEVKAAAKQTIHTLSDLLVIL